ncbi:MAG: metal ABC transporter permease [Actinomycetota bacterium]
MSFLNLGFIQAALVASAIVGAVAPVIGTFLVQRRLSLMGDGIGHIAFAGVALGFWIGVSPFLTGIVVAIVGALGIELFRRRDPESADMALALFFYGSLAAAVVIASVSHGKGAVSIVGVLFGQVLTVTRNEVLAIVMIGIVVLVVVVGVYRGMITAAIDEESATVTGLPVRTLNAGLMILTALTIGLGMKVVGILLIAALMVLPVGAARNLVRSFRATLIAAALIGAGSGIVGIVLSYVLNTASGGTIVLVAAAAYVVADVVRIVIALPAKNPAVSAGRPG